MTPGASSFQTFQAGMIPFPHQYDLRMYGNEVMDFTVSGIAFDVKDRLFKLGAHGVN